MRNKNQGRRSDVSVTITGEMGEPDPKRKHSSCVNTDIFVKAATWKELSVMAYEFPPLKEIWTTMVNAGWIRPDDIMPIDEVANAAMEIDTAEGDV